MSAYDLPVGDTAALWEVAGRHNVDAGYARELANTADALFAWAGDENGDQDPFDPNDVIVALVADRPLVAPVYTMYCALLRLALTTFDHNPDPTNTTLGERGRRLGADLLERWWGEQRPTHLNLAGELVADALADGRSREAYQLVIEAGGPLTLACLVRVVIALSFENAWDLKGGDPIREALGI